MRLNLADGADFDLEVFCPDCLEIRHGSVEYG